jgi:hypothetical protein
MTTPSLLSLFPKAEDLLALSPEDLGGAIIEVVQYPFTLECPLPAQWPLLAQGTQRSVILAITEALSWLTTQGPREDVPSHVFAKKSIAFAANHIAPASFTAIAANRPSLLRLAQSWSARTFH